MAILHDNTSLVPTFPPNASSWSITTPAHIVENPINMPLPVLPVSLYCAHQMAIESVCDSATSPDLAATTAPQNSPLLKQCPPPPVNL
jgi:hypothetical protein